MYLHKDKETFKEIIEQVADDTGCAAVVTEKDYYVIMVKIPENEWEKIELHQNGRFINSSEISNLHFRIYVS